MTEEAKARRSETPPPPAPYPHDWASVLVGTAAGALVIAIGAYLLITHVSSRPVDLRPLSERVHATVEEGLAANRIPDEGILVAVESVREPEAWFDYARFEISVPRHLDLQALGAVLRKALQREGVAVEVQNDDGGESVLRLAASGANIGEIRLLAVRPHDVSRDWPEFAINDDVPGEPDPEPESQETAGGVRAEAVRIQLPSLKSPATESEGSGNGEIESVKPAGEVEAVPAAVSSEPEIADPVESESFTPVVEVELTEESLDNTVPDTEVAANWSPPDGALPEYDGDAAIPDASSRMRVAIIVDDGGYGGSTTETILGLDPNLTLSILPYTPYAREIAKRATDLGFEVMLHMPMENLDPNLKHDGQLDVGMSPARIHALTLRALDYVPGAKGVNNHMGSRFTADRFFMDSFLEGIEELDLYFVDSRTTSNSVAHAVAEQREIPSAYRHIFLDHDNETEAIERQFDQMIALAQQQGDVVAIAHFRPKTAEVLARMLPKLQESGVALVHASALFE